MPTRRVALSWPERSVPRHFVGDDLVMSHIAAVASAMFPEGEAFFVRSIRRYRDQITDPELAEQVRGFVGQESLHAREHRNLNRALAELGYPTDHIDRRAGLALRIVERVLPPRVQLAATAALEHVTATLAEAILGSDEVRALFRDEQIRDLVTWHALEESEHKAVAFDVYREVGGSNWVRVWALRIALVTTTLDVLSGVLTSFWSDPAARSPRVVLASWRGLRQSPFAGLGMGARLLDYQRRDFHPDDHDTTALVEEWSRRLFEDGSTLAVASTS